MSRLAACVQNGKLAFHLKAPAYALQHGDEALRRTCAEALSNDPEGGFLTLQDGSLQPDPLGAGLWYLV